MAQLSRRGILGGLLGLVAAPAIVHATNIMPIFVERVAPIRAPSTEGLPDGWAACDGGVFSRADYPELFAAVGSIYGGDGITTFAVPDLRLRPGGPAVEGRPPFGAYELMPVISIRNNGLWVPGAITSISPRVR